MKVVDAAFNKDAAREGLDPEEAAIFQAMKETCPLPSKPDRPRHYISSEQWTTGGPYLLLTSEKVLELPGTEPAVHHHELVFIKETIEGQFLGKLTFERIPDIWQLQGHSWTLNDDPSAELTASEFLQMVLDHAWARGFRPRNRDDAAA